MYTGTDCHFDYSIITVDYESPIINKLKLTGHELIVYALIYSFSSPKGFKINMSLGSSVKTEIIANNIAIPVNTPKYIVGMKFDKTKIEKPKTIVIEVFKIATPTVP